MENEQVFLTPAALAKRWDISLSAVYHNHCGTHCLTRVRLERSLRFLLSEVVAYEQACIAEAKARLQQLGYDA